MKRYHLLVLMLGSLLIFNSCKKEEEIIISGNEAPPDETVETLTKENFINRSYINLLGRKPDQSEFDEAFAILEAANADSSSRQDVLDLLLAKDGFFVNQFNQSKGLLINGVDTTDLRDQRNIFALLLNDTAYMAYWDDLQYEIDRLDSVLRIIPDLQAGTLTIRGMHRRLIDNYAYDQINMGTQNFIISSFNSLLLRYPTSEELAEAEKMVEGFSAILFLNSGKTRADYMRIFFLSKDYFEGQVRDAYLKYLFREPNSDEVVSLTTVYAQTLDFKKVLKRILGTDEYLGIE